MFQEYITLFFHDINSFELQKVIVQLAYYVFNVFLASGEFCHLLILQIVWTQVRTDRASVLILIKPFEILKVFLKEFFEIVNMKKSQQTATKA